jgi:hypothetical protein
LAKRGLALDSEFELAKFGWKKWDRTFALTQARHRQVKVRTLLRIGSILLVLFGCHATSDEAKRREFVSMFLASIYQDTDFYKKYLNQLHLDELGDSRSRMTAGFEIDRSDHSAFGPYEYYVKFSNGATGVVYVAEEGGEIRSAGFYVYPLDSP